MNSKAHESLAHHLADLVLSHTDQFGVAPAAFTLDTYGDRCEFMRASSAPDRVQDITIKLPGCSQSYGVDGKNLSSLLHFCNLAGHGYCWYRDPSLPWGSAELLHLVDAPLFWEPAPDGERSPGLGPHPEEVALAGGPHLLGSHVFASAETMLRYYVAEARAAWSACDHSTWRACVGFAFHYLADLHCPHHTWGALRFGHQGWEDAAEAEWLRHAGMLALAEPGLLAEEVGRRYRARHDLDELIQELPAWGSPRQLDAPETLQAIDVSLDVLAAGLALLPLMTDRG